MVFKSPLCKAIADKPTCPSVTLTLCKLTLPGLVTVKVYVTRSPTFRLAHPFSPTVMSFVFTIAILVFCGKITTVGVSLSIAVPEVSVTSNRSGSCAVANAELVTFPASISL